MSAWQGYSATDGYYYYVLSFGMDTLFGATRQYED